jgi:hypothetical protein
MRPIEVSLVIGSIMVTREDVSPRMTSGPQTQGGAK